MNMVLTADIIDSRKKEQDFNIWFSQQIQAINRDLAATSTCQRRVFISQGDECQIFLPLETDLAWAVFLINYHLLPMQVRLSVAIGPFEGPVLENSWQMNGPLFWQAKEGLERIKSHKKRCMVLTSQHQKYDQVCNDLLTYVFKDINKWRPDTWHDVYEDVVVQDVKQLASKRNMTPDGFYKRIQRSNYKRYFQSINAIKASYGG